MTIYQRRITMRNKPTGNSGVLQTHCRKGHKFTVTNTIIRKNGQKLCRKCRNANGKIWRLRTDTPAKARGRYLKKTYNLTDAEYATMYAAQKGLCAICSKHFEKLFIDHCHKTKTVRGLLCRLCNVAIGNLQDDPTVMEAAIRYVKAHQK